MEHYSFRRATEQEQAKFSSWYAKDVDLWVVISNSDGSVYNHCDTKERAERVCKDRNRRHQEHLNELAALRAVEDQIIKILTDAGDVPTVIEGVSEYTGEWRRIELAEPISKTKFTINIRLMDSVYSSKRVHRITTCRDQKAHTRTTKDGYVNAEKLLALVASARSDCLSQHQRNIYNQKSYSVAHEVRKTLSMDSWNSINVSGLTVDVSSGSDNKARIKISGYVDAEKAAAIVDALRNLELVTA